MSFSRIEVILAGSENQRFIETSRTVKSFTIQPKRSNSHSIVVAPADNLTADSGFEFAAPASDEQIPDKTFKALGGNCLDLYEWFAIGTAGEGLNLIIEEW